MRDRSDELFAILGLRARLIEARPRQIALLHDEISLGQVLDDLRVADDVPAFVDRRDRHVSEEHLAALAHADTFTAVATFDRGAAQMPHRLVAPASLVRIEHREML